MAFSPNRPAFVPRGQHYVLERSREAALAMCRGHVLLCEAHMRVVVCVCMYVWYGILLVLCWYMQRFRCVVAVVLCDSWRGMDTS